MSVLPGTERSLVAGEVLIQEGTSTGYMYLVRAGAFAILRGGSGGTELKLGQVGPGRMLGEISLLRGEAHSTTVRALEPSVVQQISRVDFERLLEQTDTPLEKLLYDLCLNLGHTIIAATDRTVAALERELELTRMKVAIGSLLVHLVLGFAAYAVLMKALASREGGIALGAALSAPIMVAMTLMCASFMRRSGLPAAAFGLDRRDMSRSALEGLAMTAPLLVGLVATKWALVTHVPAFQGLAVAPAFHQPLSWPAIAGWLAYLCLVPMQELVARGAVRGPLSDMLTGSRDGRTFWAIVLSNALFAITHLHLTITYGLAAFVGGLAWGGLYARRRSLVGPALSHVIIGFVGLYVLGFAELLRNLP
jgi:CRP-like cAMP-binding protein